MLLSGAHLRLGELLLDVGLIRQEDIADAVQISERSHLPIGRALVMQGHLSETMLQAALEAQSLYRDGLITKRETLAALTSVKTDGVNLASAVEHLKLATRAPEFAQDVDLYRDLDHSPPVITPPQAATQELDIEPVIETTNLESVNRIKRNRLGELLVAASVLTKTQLQQHLENSTISGLPLGRYLVSIGAVNENLIATALNIQLMIRNWKMTREQGIEALKSARRRRLRGHSGADTMELPTVNKMHLGELLVVSRALSQADMMHAVEVSLLNEEQIGQALLRLGLITPEFLQSALTIQHMLVIGRLQPTQAVEALRLIYSDFLSLSEAVSRVQHADVIKQERMSFETFLRFTGMIPREAINNAIEMNGIAQDTHNLSVALMSRNAVPSALLRSCQILHSLVGNGNLTLEKAIVVLKQCSFTGKSVREVINDFNWTLQVREQV